MLFATYIAVSIIPLLLFSSVIFKTTENYYIEERKKELLNQANIFSGHITISDYLYDENKKSEFDEDIENTSTQGGYRTIVTDAMGNCCKRFQQNRNRQNVSYSRSNSQPLMKKLWQMFSQTAVYMPLQA